MNALHHKTSLALALLFFVASGFTTTPAVNTDPPSEWSIDPAHSQIGFKVTHFFTPVNGKFQEYETDIYFDPENIEESRISLTMKVNSIDTDNAKRDGHLQSPDFFHAEKYPEITFKSNKITREGDNRYVAHGDLTIKDQTKPVELPFTLLGVREHPMKENTHLAGIQSDFSLNRTEYGVGVGDWAATLVVGDQVDVSLSLELNSSGM